MTEALTPVNYYYHNKVNYTAGCGVVIKLLRSVRRHPPPEEGARTETLVLGHLPFPVWNRGAVRFSVTCVITGTLF